MFDSSAASSNVSSPCPLTTTYAAVYKVFEGFWREVYDIDVTTGDPPAKDEQVADLETSTMVALAQLLRSSGLSWSANGTEVCRSPVLAISKTICPRHSSDRHCTHRSHRSRPFREIMEASPSITFVGKHTSKNLGSGARFPKHPAAKTSLLPC